LKEKWGDVRLKRASARASKASLERDEEYAKWFQIISGESNLTHAEDLSSYSSPNYSKHTKNLKIAVAHLRIQELLLKGSLRLQGVSPEESRIVTFLPDGALGTGWTRDQASWRLYEGELQILEEGGVVRSRFVLGTDGRSMVQKLIGSGSSRPLRLIPIAAKG
jgi:hypothetical protein